jgi:hypothetical protein
LPFKKITVSRIQNAGHTQFKNKWLSAVGWVEKEAADFITIETKVGPIVPGILLIWGNYHRY